jgi:hypothetical protein
MMQRPIFPGLCSPFLNLFRMHRASHEWHNICNGYTKAIRRGQGDQALLVTGEIKHHCVGFLRWRQISQLNAKARQMQANRLHAAPIIVVTRVLNCISIDGKAMRLHESQIAIFCSKQHRECGVARWRRSHVCVDGTISRRQLRPTTMTLFREFLLGHLRIVTFFTAPQIQKPPAPLSAHRCVNVCTWPVCEDVAILRCVCSPLTGGRLVNPYRLLTMTQRRNVASPAAFLAAGRSSEPVAYVPSPL